MRDPVGALRRLARAPGIVARALIDTGHPILAHVVPTRRCNLACAYCNEYDKVSEPVPLLTMSAWIGKLAALRTEIVTISGGEPMLHPDIGAVVAEIRRHRMVAGLITNGYFLQPHRIEELNRAGLQYLQISIDNVRPDAISQKSLEVLDQKLVGLARFARFHVNVNSVLGAGCARPEDVLAITRRARELGFSTSVGVLHDGEGRLRPLGERERAVYDEIVRIGRGLYTRINGFQRNLIDGKPNDWRCPAGARYLYVCDSGLVHRCSQKRGQPAIPLADYTREHILAELTSEKECAPFCTVGCVHRVSSADAWRALLDRRGRQTPRQATVVEHLPGPGSRAAASSRRRASSGTSR